MASVVGEARDSQLESEREKTVKESEQERKVIKQCQAIEYFVLRD